ncbi:FG-GAP-like repeat-containing protein [Streptomyces sp. NPDC054887]
MHSSLRTTLAVATAAALTGGLLVAGAGAAAAAPSGLQGDFNGDGYRDLAVSASGSTVKGYNGAGAVTVLYGSPTGAGAQKIQTITQESAGVPGSAEKQDRFGGHTAAGDFNGDGYADLAIGALLEDVGSDVDGGTVVVVFGSATGLTGGVTIADPTPTKHDHFGSGVAAGDFNGDGKNDLAIKSDNNKVDVYRGGISKSGTTGGRYSVTTPVLAVEGHDIFNITAGNVNNDGRTDLVVDGYEGDSTGEYSYNANYYLPGSSAGVTTTGARKLPAGIITDIGDTNGDAYGDIVIGNSWDSGAGIAKGGAVEVVYGTASGPTGGKDTITQDTPGIPGGSETGDAFGGELSLGDINGDGFLDLAVGAPYEDLAGGADTGMVTVVYGSANGFVTTGAQAIEQDTPGVPGTSEKFDGFGGEVFLSDTTGDGKADMTVGVPWENDENGYVVAFRSDGTKISTSGRGLGPAATGISTAGAPVLGLNISG